MLAGWVMFGVLENEIRFADEILPVGRTISPPLAGTKSDLRSDWGQLSPELLPQLCRAASGSTKSGKQISPLSGAERISPSAREFPPAVERISAGAERISRTSPARFQTDQGEALYAASMAEAS